MFFPQYVFICIQYCIRCPLILTKSSVLLNNCLCSHWYFSNLMFSTCCPISSIKSSHKVYTIGGLFVFYKLSLNTFIGILQDFVGGLVSRIFRILWVGGWVGVGELVYTFYTLLGFWRYTLQNVRGIWRYTLRNVRGLLDGTPFMA